MTEGQDRRALVLGATGLVGGALLAQLSDHKAYGAISTLGRRAPEFNHGRVTHHVASFSGGQKPVTVPNADVLFCCLGTTIKQAGTEAAFRAVDFELVVQIAKQAARNGTKTFLGVSSIGADADSRNFYLRTKGEMEQAVAGLSFKRSGFVRPSYLLGEREQLRPLEHFGRQINRLLNPVLVGSLARYRAVDAGTVAAAMIGFDLSASPGIRVIEGKEIWRYGGGADFTG